MCSSLRLQTAAPIYTLFFTMQHISIFQIRQLLDNVPKITGITKITAITKSARKAITPLMYAVLGIGTGLILYMVISKYLYANSCPFVHFFAGISTSSMSPSLSKGDLAVFSPQPSYNPGDIVVFRHNKHLITHRILSIQGDSIVTKGDANALADPENIHRKNIIGKLKVKIPTVAWPLIVSQQLIDS